MQPDQITLSVDVSNDGNPVDVVYNKAIAYQDRTVYFAAGHTNEMRDMMTLYRTFPKTNGQFKGVGKSSVKFTRDIVVTDSEGNNIVSPQILEIPLSNPVGATPAQSMEMRQRALACLDLDAVSAPLNDVQII